MSKCPNCGTELDAGAKFCTECGATIPQTKKCIQCGVTLPQSTKFCPECGTCQNRDASVAPIMGDKNVIAGDVIGAKIAGDSVGNKIMGNAIYNTIQDETKKVLSCIICGKHLTNDNAYTCPKCKRTVCSDHFDTALRCCADCARKEKGEIVVDKLGLGDVTTIAEAVSLAKENGIIKIKYGLYEENIVIDKKISIIGEANEYGEFPTICGNRKNNPNTIEIKARSTLKDLSITTNDEIREDVIIDREIGNGIVIYCDSTIESCSVHNNTSNGILVKRGNPLLLSSTVFKNKTCGIVIESGALGRIEKCNIYENEKQGLLISDKETKPIIRECQIHEGKSIGVEFTNGAQGCIESCNIFKNDGSGISIQNSSQENVLTNPTTKKCNIYQNKKDGIEIKSGAKGLIDGCDIYENVNSGICIQDLSTNPLITNCKIHNCSENGVRIHIKGKGEITNCEIFENGSSGILLQGIEVNPFIKDCKVHHNQQSCIFVKDGAVGNITNCDFFSSWQFRGNNPPVGIILEGTETNPSIRNCKIHECNNGGILIKKGANGVIEACDIFENKAPGNIIIEDDGTNPIIEDCKIYDFNYGELTSQTSGILIKDGALGFIKKCDIYKNDPSGIRIHGSNTNPNITECKIHNGRIGVLICDEAQGVIENCEIFENQITGNISIEGQNTNPIIKKCKLHDSQMCGIWIKTGALGFIIECDISRNSIDAILIQDYGTCPTITGCWIHNEKQNGILISRRARAIIADCNLENNAQGDFLFNDPDPSISINNCLCNGKNYSLKNGQWIQEERSIQTKEQNTETVKAENIKTIEPKDKSIEENPQRDEINKQDDAKAMLKAVAVELMMQKLTNLGISLGSFKDERDGNEYKTITIGKQTWMANSLRYIENSGVCSLNECVTQNDNSETFLYTWAAMMHRSKNKVSPYLGSRIMAFCITTIIFAILGIILNLFTTFSSISDYIFYWLAGILYTLFIGCGLVIKLSPRANNNVEGGYFGIGIPLIAGIIVAFIYSDTLFWGIWISASILASFYSFAFLANNISFPIFIKSIAPKGWRIPSKKDVRQLAKYLKKFTEIDKDAFIDIQNAIKVTTDENFIGLHFWLNNLVYNDSEYDKNQINSTYSSSKAFGDFDICKKNNAVHPVICIKK